VLRHGGDDAAECRREEQEITRQQRRGDRHGDTRRQRIVAERTTGAEQEHADQPGRDPVEPMVQRDWRDLAPGKARIPT
jgi:hypothetical protein